MTTINDGLINLNAHIDPTNKVMVVTPYGIYSFKDKNHLHRWYESTIDFGFNFDHILVFERTSSMLRYETETGDSLFVEVQHEK